MNINRVEKRMKRKKSTIECPYCGGKIEEEEVAGLMIHKRII